MPGCLASRGTGLLSEAETEKEKRSLITLADPRFCKSVSVNVMTGGRERETCELERKLPRSRNKP